MFLPIQMNVIECLLWAAVAGFELTISSGVVLLLTRQVSWFNMAPDGFAPTVCLEGAAYKNLSAASGVAYKGTRHLSRS
jgi:hypothetical protein